MKKSFGDTLGNAIVKNLAKNADVDPKKISARNILTGTITRIVPGVVNDEVTLDLAGGNTVTSILTSASVKRLGLKEGMSVAAVIKASDVLLAVA